MRQLRARNYSMVGMICSGEPIMTKWKWLIALRLPVKVFIINENGDYFWINREQAGCSARVLSGSHGAFGRGCDPHHRAIDSSFPSAFCFCYCMLSRRTPAESCARCCTLKTMKQIQISQFGGPEVMKLADAPKPSPAAGPGAGKNRGRRA